VRLKRTAEALRQYSNPLAHSLAFAHGNLAVPKIDVLYTQPKTFQQAQTASVEELRHQTVIAFQPGEDATCFDRGKNDRQFGRTPDTLHSRDEIEFPVEDLLIEKKQGAQRLILGGSCHLSFNREVAEEGSNLRFAHFVGVALAMKEDEAPDPIDVGLLGADAIMFDPQVPADAVEQFRR
jgi:hypothetical protein